MIRILYVVGSPEDEEKFASSLLYSRPIEQYEDVRDYMFSFAVVFPDKQWCFPNNLKTESINQAEKVPINEAIRLIISTINPTTVISGMYCKSGHTLYASLFQLLGLQLIGPPTEAAVIASDKIFTRRILTHAGVPMPPGFVLSKHDQEQLHLAINDIGFPCIVKSPCTEDSIATVKASGVDDLNGAIDHCYAYGDDIIVEKFIRGRELRSGVIEDNNGNLIFLPVIEYIINEDEIRNYNDKFPRSANGEVDLKSKHSEGHCWFLDPVKEEVLLEKVKKYSLKAFRLLHCRSYALFDIRVDADGNPFILEANLYCSFSPYGIINVMAKQAGISGKDVIDFAIASASRN